MTKQEMIDKTNEAITELVYDKSELQKAYNYYAGKRDPEQYRYLEENYGIGNPTSVEFTPLIKKHVDALIGEYLGTPIIPKISCKDEATIGLIGREKQLKIKESVFKYLKDHLSNSLLKFIDGKDITDKTVKTQLDKIIQDIDQSFMSEYEIAAQNVIQYILQSRQTDIITKLRHMLLDLLITGYVFYRVKESTNGTNIDIEVLNPLNTFIDRNPDSVYVKDSYRIVVRKFMTRTQIINKYGSELTKQEIKDLKDTWKDHGEYTKYGYAYGMDTFMIDARYEFNEERPGYPGNNSMNQWAQFIPVYEVEWLEVDNDFKMDRYQTVRIGEDIFITRGKDETVIRSQDNPKYCGLSVNGIFYLNRSSNPYSLVLACAHLQDKYDLLCYYRDTIIANSGVKGQIMDYSLIPSWLGVKWPERIEKWIAYRKAGHLLIDSSQEGRNDNGNSPMNTIFNGYDDTIPVQAIQAIQLAIDQVEQTTCSITGVFRERLNGIEQRDAVTNIKQGVTNSFTITKHIYQQMDTVTCELLTDGLNQAKITWKNGLTGTIVLGENQQKIFTALPEYFTISDFDIHVISSTQVMEDMERIKSTIPDFIKSGSVSPDIIFECLTAKSLSDLKYKVKKALQIQKEENNQIMQLQQKLEETSQQAQQLEKDLKQARHHIEAYHEKNLESEQRRIQLEYQVGFYKAQTERQYRTDWAEIERSKVAIEESQLHDGNPYNDKVKF